MLPDVTRYDYCDVHRCSAGGRLDASPYRARRGPEQEAGEAPALAPAPCTAPAAARGQRPHNDDAV